ncbi:MAG: hypothetical protein OXE95_13045 [Chloroflexi bacterium]|nr:hypothetical protein [Chloroflexota bacterium]MCY4248489.1 hypothetical protein [Chloroflexota bacterium]
MRATRAVTISPEPDEFAVLPVWQPIAAQIGIMAVAALAIVLATELLGLRFEGVVRRALSLALALLPLLLWLLLSALPESRFARPRDRLLGIAALSGLCASAVGLPLIEDFYQIGQWLPLGSVIQRIIGYTVTVGIVDVGIKFMILRFLALPQSLRARSDAVAYAMAAAVGYSFTINLFSIWRLDPVWELAAIVALSNVAIQFASSMAMALGIIASYFDNAFPSVLPLSLVVAALSTGLIAPQAPGLTSGPLGTAGNATRPLFGIAFLLAALLLSLAVAYFLYRNAERRQRETTPGRGAGRGA